jgi:hypothetical protein
MCARLSDVGHDDSIEILMPQNLNLSPSPKAKVEDVDNHINSLCLSPPKAPMKITQEMSESQQVTSIDLMTKTTKINPSSNL